MKFRNPFRLALIALPLVLAATPGTAADQISWPEIECSCSTDQEAMLLVHPDGSGSPLTEARFFGGGIVDATIRARVTNGFEEPVVNFPAEDLWILSVPNTQGTIYTCQNGTIADRDTDADGWTEWSEPLRAGGYSEPGVDLMYAFMSGMPSIAGCPLQWNSPDLTGDGEVNLSDIARFAQDFYGTYHVRSDLVWDGVLNLSDLGRLALGIGRECP